MMRKLVYNSIYRTTQNHLITTLDVDVIETKFKEFWKELTCSYKLRTKTQFCILQHPQVFTDSITISKFLKFVIFQKLVKIDIFNKKQMQT